MSKIVENNDLGVIKEYGNPIRVFNNICIPNVLADLGRSAEKNVKYFLYVVLSFSYILKEYLFCFWREFWQ